MDEASAIFDYLPVSFKSEEEQAYIAFLWDAFQSNYENEKYQFAFLAFHMLTMCFVYCNVWQIKKNSGREFTTAMIGFGRDEDRLLQASSPFTFCVINERTIFRFFRLLGCDSEKIGRYVKLVDERNKAAHSNGQIFINDKDRIDRKINDTLDLIKEIESYSTNLIQRCYESFLVGSANAEVREHMDANDQIREILIHENYFSRRDIGFCQKYDIQALSAEPDFNGIVALHQALLNEYDVEEL